MTVAQAAVGTTCQLVRGNSLLGKFKRTVVRTELSRIPMPIYLCPSGYTMIPGFTSCVPITTAQAAVFVLTAQGTCDGATIQSVKDAITNYLSSPYSAFGECSVEVLMGRRATVNHPGLYICAGLSLLTA